MYKEDQYVSIFSHNIDGRVGYLLKTFFHNKGVSISLTLLG